MIGDQTDGNILLIVLLILCMSHLADAVTDCLHGINIKDRIHILYNNSETFQTHSGIDILILEFLVAAMSVSVKLGKYIVPYLHETVTVAANLTIRFATAVLLSSVVINFRARTTRTCTMLPEVITFPVLITVESGDLLSRHTDLLCPDIVCLFILTVDRRI